MHGSRLRRFRGKVRFLTPFRDTSSHLRCRRRRLSLGCVGSIVRRRGMRKGVRSSSGLELSSTDHLFVWYGSRGMILIGTRWCKLRVWIRRLRRNGTESEVISESEMRLSRRVLRLLLRRIEGVSEADGWRRTILLKGRQRWIRIFNRRRKSRD